MKFKFDGLYYIKGQFQGYASTCVEARNIKEAKDALKEKVWLKSGGYLFIQHTEAMAVIDVNSGKSISKKAVQEHYLKI